MLRIINNLMATEETEMKKAVKEYLRMRGVFFYHNLAGMGVYAGIPDITAISKGVAYGIEVKARKGKQSENQKQFQRDWEAAGGIYILGGIDEVMRIIV